MRRATTLRKASCCGGQHGPGSLDTLPWDEAPHETVGGHPSTLANAACNLRPAVWARQRWLRYTARLKIARRWCCLASACQLCHLDGGQNVPEMTVSTFQNLELCRLIKPPAVRLPGTGTIYPSEAELRAARRACRRLPSPWLCLGRLPKKLGRRAIIKARHGRDRPISQLLYHLVPPSEWPAKSETTSCYHTASLLLE